MPAEESPRDLNLSSWPPLLPPLYRPRRPSCLQCCQQTEEKEAALWQKQAPSCEKRLKGTSDEDSVAV